MREVKCLVCPTILQLEPTSRTKICSEECKQIRAKMHHTKSRTKQKNSKKKQKTSERSVKASMSLSNSTSFKRSRTEETEQKDEDVLIQREIVKTPDGIETTRETQRTLASTTTFRSKEEMEQRKEVIIQKALKFTFKDYVSTETVKHLTTYLYTEMINKKSKDVCAQLKVTTTPLCELLPRLEALDKKYNTFHLFVFIFTKFIWESRFPHLIPQKCKDEQGKYTVKLIDMRLSVIRLGVPDIAAKYELHYPGVLKRPLQMETSDLIDYFYDAKYIDSWDFVVDFGMAGNTHTHTHTHTHPERHIKPIYNHIFRYHGEG